MIMVLAAIIMAPPLDKGEPPVEVAHTFHLVFGLSPLDEQAQVAVDNYFEVMLKVACQATKRHYEHPELERAQELAEGLGFSVSLEYKRFRYGGKCSSGQ